MSATPATLSRRRHALTLAALVLAAIVLVILVSRWTEPRVAAAAADLAQRHLADVLPATDFDPERSGDRLIRPHAAFGADAPLPIVRRWRNGQPAAAALSVIAPDGYNGAIALLVGVDVDGQITGVRVSIHRETPGLGDDIERRRSDWITRFDGLSLDDPPSADWSVRPRGGRFDAFTGATITPQAVVRAVHRALRWYRENRSAVFSLPRGAAQISS